MTLTMESADRYNWDIGKSISIPGMGNVQDAHLGRLDIVGLAREYSLSGYYTIALEWQKGNPSAVLHQIGKEPPTDSDAQTGRSGR